METDDRAAGVFSAADLAVEAVASTLQRHFGNSFSLYRNVSPASSVGEPTADDAYPAEYGAHGDLIRTLQQKGSDVVIRGDGSGGREMAFSLAPAGMPPMIAVATVPDSPEKALTLLAASAAREVCRENSLQEHRLQLDSCVRQISSNLEEITFLQQLSGYLQVCDISRSLTEVAGELLPALRELLHCVAVAFVVRPDSAGGDPGGTLWAGPALLENAYLQRLAKMLLPANSERPLVRNRLGDRFSFPDLPGIENFIVVQVGGGESPVGWLVALNRTLNSDTDGQRELPLTGLSDCEMGTVEASLLQSAAGMLAAHARNVRLNREREKTFAGIVRAMVNSIEAKDSYTCGHSDRVALISRRLAEELGLDRRQCDHIYLAALMHDVGKIGVPDAVLRKTGRLSDEEYDAIKRHPVCGRAILRHLDHLSHVVPAVLHHHERFDGAGYPAGLTRDAIPLEARIIAVADSYDAMSSARPYRQPLPPAKVEAILREGAGTQWDPRIVEIFLRLLPEIVAICDGAEEHTQALLTGNHAAAICDTALAGATP